MILLDGKATAEVLKAEVRTRVDTFSKRWRRAPCLTTLLVGDDPASQVYIRNKIKACQDVGIHSCHESLSATLSEQSLLTHLEQLNADPLVDGILVQMPVPPQINAQKIIGSLNPQKDVDGFHPENVGAMFSGFPRLSPCTPAGVMEMLRRHEIEVEGREALVIGRSNIVGKPMAAMLINAGATVTVAHRRTHDLQRHLKHADLVVVAIGKPNFIQAEWLMPGAVVVDVGINRLADGRLCGDVDFENAKKVVAAITPVPGGVGPMTIAMLLKNTIQAAEARMEKL